MDNVIEIDSDSDFEYDGDDYIPRMVKREDSDISNGGSKGDSKENQDDVLVEEVNEGEEEKYPCLGRGHRVLTQTTTDYVPS